MPTKKMNLSTLMVDFDTDSECRTMLEDLRWPQGVRCVKCNSDHITLIRTRKQYACSACKHRFSVTTGTLFNDTHLALPKWFMAVLLMVEAKKGMSARQMQRTLGVAKKTAWYLCHRIREAMAELEREKLTGRVEVDETYIGGKRQGHGRGRGNYLANKTMVLAALQRGGEVRFSTGPVNTKKVLHGFVKSTVDDDATHIYTDDWPGYNDVGDEDTQHESVNHSHNEWVRGDVHTNTVEGAFGLLKRSIVGSFHQISTKHIDRYLTEAEFKYNNRKNPYLFRDTLRKLVTTDHIEYKKLTA